MSPMRLHTVLQILQHGERKGEGGQVVLDVVVVARQSLRSSRRATRASLLALEFGEPFALAQRFANAIT